jgi:general stress protein 26
VKVQDGNETVWNLVKEIGTTMLVTRSGEQLDARPLQAYPDRFAGMIYFMSDSDRLLEQLKADGRVLLNLIDKAGNNYVSLSGKARVSDDRDKIRYLWTAWAQAYWKGPEDPNIRLVSVTPEHARFWDAPNAAVATVAMLAGALTGKQPKLGTSGEVQL